VRGARALLIDLDGVIYQDEDLIEGAPQALAWLREQAIVHAFVTNTTSRPRQALVGKLACLGVPASEEQIVTPTVVAAEWLRRQGLVPAALLVPPAARDDFAHIPSLADDAESGAACVVVGDLGPSWTFAALNRAFRLLMANPSAALIALGTTRYWRAAEGLRLDVGPFVAALEYAVGRQALVLGKPAREFFDIAARTVRCPPAEIVMIGDDITSDVRGSQEAGMQGVLVKTGKFREEDLTGEIHPDGVLHSVADLPAWWHCLHHVVP
jgi:phospholysine phosphohistidine inorganic pyrophosphate phosphatase